jgi:hypothetical protein
MSVLDSLTKHANRLASDVQVSLRRARVEGERRLLQRQHRTALEELGERAYELVRAGTIPEEPLATEVAAVESKLMEIEAKVAEIESLRAEEEGGSGEGPGEGPGEGVGDDPSRTAFPMVDTPSAGSEGGPGPGAGWEAAERFFGDSSSKR